MLPSLYIKNYRNLKELTINSLGRINLIAGKNNTGKTSILEAISIYANKGEIESIVQILEQRAEYIKKGNNSQGTDFKTENIKTLSSLFYGREYSFKENDRVEIGIRGSKNLVSFGFIRMIADEQILPDGTTFKTQKIVPENEIISDFDLSFQVKINGATSYTPLNKNLDHYTNSIFTFAGRNPDKNQFIRTNNIYKDINNTLFDNIALTEKEQYVIEALKIIEPRTERIAFVEGYNKTRTAVVKLSGESSVVPIGSMGDGINRLLTIILALVNSSDGYLLIDEFENGLHYTIQDQLWKIVFKLAVDLNIQVFATTHSNDCIASFTRILNKQQNKDLGKYIRLDNVNEEIKEVSFSPEELDIANDQDIEIR